MNLTCDLIYKSDRKFIKPYQASFAAYMEPSSILSLSHTHYAIIPRLNLSLRLSYSSSFPPTLPPYLNEHDITEYCILKSSSAMPTVIYIKNYALLYMRT